MLFNFCELLFLLVFLLVSTLNDRSAHSITILFWRTCYSCETARSSEFFRKTNLLPAMCYESHEFPEKLERKRIFCPHGSLACILTHREILLCRDKSTPFVTKDHISSRFARLSDALFRKRSPSGGSVGHEALGIAIYTRAPSPRTRSRFSEPMRGRTETRRWILRVLFRFYGIDNVALSSAGNANNLAKSVVLQMPCNISFTKRNPSLYHEEILSSLDWTEIQRLR